MAQSTAMLTYNSVGNREDLMDIITNISPYDTPMFSAFKRDKATATYHEWIQESLTTGSDNASIEGADYSFTKPTARVRVGGYTQIFTKTWDVSRTQEVVDKAGLEGEWSRRMQNALKEIGTDIEKALVTGTGNAGASGTARRLKGTLAWVATNVTTGTGSGNEVLTETMYNDNLQLIFAQGGRPDMTFVNAWQKRKISGFSGASQRNIDSSTKKIIAPVEVYESEFGLISIKLDRWMDTDKVLNVQSDLWAVSVLRPVMADDRVKQLGDADSIKGAVVGELTLSAFNEKGNGKITQLSTTST